MSSVNLTSPTNEAFADIKEEIAAEAAADPTKKKLGVLFWICAGWIVLVALGGHLRQPPARCPTRTSGTTTACRTAGPSWGHLLGTDDLYRDIFSRLIYGARVSLIVGFGGALIGLLVGGIPAMISAYRRGRIDTVAQHGLLRRARLPRHRRRHRHRVVLGQVAVQDHARHRRSSRAPLIFRVVRASTLSYATRDFVLAAKALGASDTRILSREILPNIMPTIVSFGLIAVATIIVLEGSLAFLGLSVAPPTPSWGNMLNEGSSLLTGAKGQTNPWLVIFPATAMFLLLISLNVVADKLRAYFDVTEIKL